MNGDLLQLLIDSFWQILLPGLTMTIPLTIISFSLAMVIAVVVALVQFANVSVLQADRRASISGSFRGTPLLVQLFVVFYGLPRRGHRAGPVSGGHHRILHSTRARIARKPMRAALESVPAGQMEAGYCVGMSYLQIIRRIVLPQAHAHGLPAAVQFADLDGEGHVAGGEHHRDGNVHGDAAHRGAHL